MNLYEILGLDKSASQSEIKRAYKKMAQKNHPDKNGGDSEKFNQLEKLLGRVESKSDFNIFESTINAKIEIEKNNMEHCEFGIKLHSKILELLKDYSDKYEIEISTVSMGRASSLADLINREDALRKYWSGNT